MYSFLRLPAAIDWPSIFQHKGNMDFSKYTQILQWGGGGGGKMQEVDGNQTGDPASVDNPHTAPTGKSVRRASGEGPVSPPVSAAVQGGSRGPVQRH